MITAAEAMSIFVRPNLQNKCSDPRLVCNLGTYNLSIALPIDLVQQKAGDKLSVMYDHAFDDMSVYVEQTPAPTGAYYGNTYHFSTARLNCDISELKPVLPSMRFYLHHEDGVKLIWYDRTMRSLGKEFYTKEYRDKIMSDACGSADIQDCFGAHSFGFLMDSNNLRIRSEALKEQKRRRMLMHVDLLPRFFDQFSHQFRYEIIFEELPETNSSRTWLMEIGNVSPKAVYASQIPEDFGFRIVRERFDFFGADVTDVLNCFWREQQ